MKQTEKINIRTIRSELVELCFDRWHPTADFLHKLLLQVKETKDLSLLDQVDPEVRWNEVVNGLEAIEIDKKHTDVKHPMYFVRGRVWYPCVAGHEHWHSIYGPCLDYVIEYKDGTRETGTAFPGDWACCCADNTPCIPFKYNMEPEHADTDEQLSQDKGQGSQDGRGAGKD